MNDFLRAILEGINSIVHNHAWSIVIFTILIRFILMPFDIKSRKGMRQMQKLQPELNRLQKKYGDDKQKLQMKQSELFRKEHYSPLSGCLPMLLTLPILWCMFNAMRAIANEETVREAFYYVANLQPPQESWLWVKNIWHPDSLFVSIAPDLSSLTVIGQDVWQKVYESLDADMVQQIIANIPNYVDGMIDFSTSDAAKTTIQTLFNAMELQPVYLAASEAVPGWQNLNFFLFSVTLYKQYNGLLILPILAGLSQVLMTKLTPGADASANTQTNPSDPNAASQQSMNSMMKYLFPCISVFFCLTSNAGFAVYWVTSNIIATIQNYAINRYFEKKDQLAAAASDEGDVK